MKLSKELESFRCDRPSEWKMDDFIQKAKLLEAYIIEANEKAEHFEREMYLMEDIRDALAEKYRELENEMYNLKQQLTPTPKCFITNQGFEKLKLEYEKARDDQEHLLSKQDNLIDDIYNRGKIRSTKLED